MDGQFDLETLAKEDCESNNTQEKHFAKTVNGGWLLSGV